MRNLRCTRYQYMYICILEWFYSGSYIVTRSSVMEKCVWECSHSTFSMFSVQKERKVHVWEVLLVQAVVLVLVAPLQRTLLCNTFCPGPALWVVMAE